jgi:hypothetical protein
VGGGRRRLHNEELHNLYTSSNIKRVIILRMRWVGNVASMGVMRSAYKMSVRNPEGKRPLGRPRCRWEDNIRVDLEVGWEVVDWIIWLRIETNSGPL